MYPSSPPNPRKPGWKPGHAALRHEKRPEALHRDLERLGVGPCHRPRVVRPNAPHRIAPDRVEVGRSSVEIVVDQRPLKQVEAAGMVAVELFEPLEHAFIEQDVAIEAEHRFALSFAKNQVARRRGSDGVGGQDVAAPGRTFDEGSRGLTTEVVDDEELDPVHVLIKAEGLDGEIDPVEVAIGRHSDGQFHGDSLSWTPHPRERRLFGDPRMPTGGDRPVRAVPCVALSPCGSSGARNGWWRRRRR